MKKIYLLILPLLILSLYGGCSTDTNTSVQTPDPTPVPTPDPTPFPTGLPPGGDCLDASRNSSILEDSIDCPTDALFQMCNRFICSSDEPNVDLENPSFRLDDCTASGCFDFECDISDFSGTREILGTGNFSIETVSGNQITGPILIDNHISEEMTEFTYSCSPLVF